MSGADPLRSESIDAYAAAQSVERRRSVRLGSKAGYDKRSESLERDYPDSAALRRLAAEIKQHALDHLDQYLEQTQARLEERGVRVHFASDAGEACALVLELARSHGARSAVKTKSMATEEIELLPYLERHGIECVETDLGEFIVQLDADRPSHIVKPILHKNRAEVARTFERHGLGPYDDTPETITRRARAFLRRKYLAADLAITGANFVSAESGRIVLVTNEGNSRFCLAAARTAITVVGIEKIVPRDRDLAVLLNLLARSATGQALSVYTEFIRGPRAPGRPDGPETLHVVFLDNGRSTLLGGPTREILRCIRCGACQNVCPVYRQASGHAYRSVYSGPVGAVLTPLLAATAGTQGLAEFGDLPSASSLCGACQEVCPVDIPLPDLLLRLRDRVKREAPHHVGESATVSLSGWARVASRPWAWELALALGGVAARLPESLRPRPLRIWTATHALPAWRGGAFRRWFARRGGAR